MSLQDYLDRFPSPMDALTQPFPEVNVFPYPEQHSDWRDEQRAWSTTAVLFNQSWHMADLYVSGPDVVKLLSDTSVNSYAGFGPGRAKQYLPVNRQGYVIGDAILFGLEDDLYSIVGSQISQHWLQFHAETGGYDVTFSSEPGRMFAGQGPVPKRLFRYELEGPNAQKILEKAIGGRIDPIKFFRMAEFTIGGHQVKALSHTMAAAPGAENTGLELFGPEEHHEEFLKAILEAGEEYGLVRGGAIAYGSTLAESGWISSPVPAIYTAPDLQAYRDWLPEFTIESVGTLLAGSFRPETIEGYYRTPWDLGYGHVIKFDHDFIGREALEEMATKPHGQKVWLSWNEEDTERVLVDSELNRPDMPRPLNPYKMDVLRHDQVLVNGELVGTTHVHAYTVNVGWVSIAAIKQQDAVEGAEVEILWGDHDGGAGSPFVPEHAMRRIRATVHLASPGPR
jgi:glycine cleavage system aminomethyltransferase T